MSANEIRRIMNLVESTLDADYDEMIAIAYEAMQDLAEEYRGHATRDSESHVGQYRQAHGGMIQAARNVPISGGYYGIDRNYVVFLKIGANVAPEIQDRLQEDFLSTMAATGIGLKGEQPHIVTNKGTLVFGTVDGSNWSGFGLFLA